MRALFVHGVGTQVPGFSVTARRNLRSALARKGLGFYALEALWAPLADRYETAFLRATKALGSDGNEPQRLSTGTLADATLYQSNADLRGEIFALFDAQLARLYHPPVVFAHSLGVLAFTDYLRARPHARIERLVSMGCNLGIFWMGRTFDCPEQLKPNGVWRNYWTPSDGLGWPLHAQSGFEQVVDAKVRVGGWFDRFTGLSHCAWWDDRKLWSDTIPRYLRG